MKKPNVLKEFVKDRNVASIASTSKHIVEKICNKIDFNKKLIIVEYGPGTGVFTKYLLDNMNNDSRLIAVETNNYFVKNLKDINDSRLIVVHDSAENIREILNSNNVDKVHHIISGIPFSFIKKPIAINIIKQSKDILENEGSFFVYQVSGKIEKHLKEFFPCVFKEIDLINLPPLHIYEARKMIFMNSKNILLARDIQ